MREGIHRDIAQRFNDPPAIAGEYTGSNASVAPNTTTAITLSASSDPYGFLSGGNIVVPAGYWMITLMVYWTSGLSGTDAVYSYLRKNGGTIGTDIRYAGASNCRIMISRPDACADGDAIDCSVRHNSSAARAMNAYIQVFRVGGLGGLT